VFAFLNQQFLVEQSISGKRKSSREVCKQRQLRAALSRLGDEVRGGSPAESLKLREWANANVALAPVQGLSLLECYLFSVSD